MLTVVVQGISLKDANSTESVITKAKTFDPENFDKVIAENKIVLFSLKSCPYCKKAKKILQKKNAKTYMVQVNTLKNAAKVINFVNDKSGDSKYPKIYINGEYLGNYEALKKLSKDDEKWAAAVA